MSRRGRLRVSAAVLSFGVVIYPHRSHMYNFGKRVKDIDSLPKKVIEFIKYITQ